MAMDSKEIQKACELKKKAVIAQDVQLYREWLEYEVEIGRMSKGFIIQSDEEIVRRLRQDALQWGYVPEETKAEARQWLIDHEIDPEEWECDNDEDENED